MIPNVLSIAGSDPSGGAGIQADVKAISANGCYAMAAITALTAQNTQGVYGVELVSRQTLSPRRSTRCSPMCVWMR
jgi:hydroxymethylpyrimidine/phosphomethylpyrimidine kinase